jgi:vacuolar-type H+-ATPase subunit D/Vma8
MSQELNDKLEMRAAELIEEFRNYLDQCREMDSSLDGHTVFESWAVQKLSGIQLFVEEMYTTLQEQQKFIDGLYRK